MRLDHETDSIMPTCKINEVCPLLEACCVLHHLIQIYTQLRDHLTYAAKNAHDVHAIGAQRFLGTSVYPLHIFVFL